MNNKTIKQICIAAGLLFTTTFAHADQCQLIPVEQIAKALNHIKPESEFVNFCEPCGDKDFHKQSVQKVDGMKVTKDDTLGQTYWEISVNGRGIDLAYTFLRTTDGSYLNLSKLADCPSEGVSAGFAAPEKSE